MTTITPFLWFNGNLADALRLYTAVFKDARIVSQNPMTAEFELAGQRFIGLNGGPKYTFNEAVSFLISVKTQEEVDHYWKALTVDGGAESMCGWLRDRFGVSWQIIPRALPRLMGDADPARAARVAQAMMQMRRIVVADLEKAHAG